MGKGKAPSKVEILSRKRLLESYMSVDEVLFRTELLGGGMSDVMDREVVGRGNAASALVRHETSGKLVLIRQFRLPAYEETSSGWILELPAGAIEEGERPDQAIRREIREGKSVV